MKFEEVLPALREGKKIRIRYWNKDKYIYINSKGGIVNQRGGTFAIILYNLSDLEADDWEIVKEPKKVKLRDLTEEQYKKWQLKNCSEGTCLCSDCVFGRVNCLSTDCCWIKDKSSFSDKFLDQEIEIEEE